jgi:hypothetical protein
MPQITIQVRNAELVAKGLANIRAEIPKISERTIEKAANAIVKKMRIYPAQPAGSRYVRTYKLRDSWKVKRASSGFTVSGDPTSKGRRYGRYVVGDFAGAGQAWMHVGRWLLFRDVAEYEVSKLPPMVEDHIRMKVRSENLA